MSQPQYIQLIGRVGLKGGESQRPGRFGTASGLWKSRPSFPPSSPPVLGGLCLSGSTFLGFGTGTSCEMLGPGLSSAFRPCWTQKGNRGFSSSSFSPDTQLTPLGAVIAFLWAHYTLTHIS